MLRNKTFFSYFPYVLLAVVGLVLFFTRLLPYALLPYNPEDHYVRTPGVWWDITTGKVIPETVASNQSSMALVAAPTVIEVVLFGVGVLAALMILCACITRSTPHQTFKALGAGLQEFFFGEES